MKEDRKDEGRRARRDPNEPIDKPGNEPGDGALQADGTTNGSASGDAVSVSPEAAAGQEPAPDAVPSKRLKGQLERVPPEQVRVDKWLWAARFFKTRSIAATAVTGGKVELNGERPKRSKHVHVGDALVIRKGIYTYEITISRLTERRGGPALAQTLYEESEASKQARAELAEQLALERANSLPPVPRPRFAKGRPTKRDRRAMLRIKTDP